MRVACGFAPPPFPPLTGGASTRLKDAGLVAACLFAAGSLIVCEESHGCANAPLTGESPIMSRIAWYRSIYGLEFVDV